VNAFERASYHDYYNDELRALVAHRDPAIARLARLMMLMRLP
jgi:hypothetical protein